jgi:HTH-type transcriptional regulator/antitoxin HigA
MVLFGVAHELISNPVVSRRQYQLRREKPLDAVRFLMDQHGLKQKDLVDVFATPSIVSEVLSGKRELNKDHIKRLSERFHLSPEIFF